MGRQYIVDPLSLHYGVTYNYEYVQAIPTYRVYRLYDMITTQKAADHFLVQQWIIIPMVQLELNLRENSYEKQLGVSLLQKLAL